VRAAPDAAAPIVATVVEPEVIAFVSGFVIARKLKWTEIEVIREHARIRGYVRDSELTDTKDILHGIGTGGGTGFGMSHSDRIDVPAGTCLFDREDGQVVGVQIKTAERLGERRSEVAGWSKVYVDSPWAVLPIFVHDTGSDPNQRTLESCAAR
jgi:hypothetical protein